MNRFNVFACLLSILLLLASCQQNVRYGSKYSRYSNDRIALFGGKNKQSTKTRHRPKRQVVVADHRDKSPNHNSVNYSQDDFQKVKYHSERTKVLFQANKYQGIPYHYGGKSPSTGFDCSGFVGYVFSEENFPLKGTASQLSRLGHKKSPDQLQKGDLVFFGSNGKINHVGIITLNDGENLTMIHSSSSSGIRSDNITHSDYWSKRMLFGTDVITAHLEGSLSLK